MWWLFVNTAGELNWRWFYLFLQFYFQFKYNFVFYILKYFSNLNDNLEYIMTSLNILESANATNVVKGTTNCVPFIDCVTSINKYFNKFRNILINSETWNQNPKTGVIISRVTPSDSELWFNRVSLATRVTPKDSVANGMRFFSHSHKTCNKEKIVAHISYVMRIYVMQILGIIYNKNDSNPT